MKENRNPELTKRVRQRRDAVSAGSGHHRSGVPIFSLISKRDLAVSGVVVTLEFWFRSGDFCRFKCHRPDLVVPEAGVPMRLRTRFGYGRTLVPSRRRTGSQ